jgi:hypothetical protein
MKYRAYLSGKDFGQSPVPRSSRSQIITIVRSGFYTLVGVKTIRLMNCRDEDG